MSVVVRAVIGLAALLLVLGPPQGATVSMEALGEVRELIKAGDYEAAEKTSRELLADVEAKQGVSSMDAAAVLDLLVEARWRGGKSADPQTLELAHRAVAIKESEAGRTDAEVAISLRNLGTVLEYSGNLEGAEAVYERAIEIRLRELGPDAADLAVSYIDLANLFLSSERYQEAGPVYEKALAIQQKQFGARAPETSYTLHNLGILSHALGDFDSAREYYELALEIREKHSQHLNVAWTLNGLAVLIEELGDYEEARTLFERALAIREEHLSPDHIHIAWVLNNLGKLLELMGDYAGARSAYERALEIHTKVGGPKDLDVALTQGNLGDLYYLLGDYSDAKRLFEQSLAIRISVLGPDQVEVAGSLQRMARVTFDLGDYAEAKEFYRRAQAIYRAQVGEQHPFFAETVDGLAAVEVKAGQLESAEALYLQALRVREHAFDKDHPEIADSLCRLAELREAQGDSDEAAALYLRAIGIREKALGVDHPRVATALTSWADVVRLTGDREAALAAALRAERIGAEHLRLTSRTLGERQALRYAGVRSSGLDLALTIALADPDGSDLEMVWDSVVRSRALVLDEMASRRRSVVQSDDPEVARLSEELAAASRSLANLAFRGPEAEAPERYRRLIEEATRAQERAEQELARISLAFRERSGQSREGLESVIRALPSGMALVAFVSYNARPVPGEAGFSSVRTYVGFVQRPGRARPVAVPLGPATEIDALVRTWQGEASRGAIDSGRDETAALRAYREAGEALRKRVWDPVARETGDADRVLIVPDGALHLLSFASLPTDGGRFVLETGPLIHYLATERDLLSIQESESQAGLLVMGGPDFEDTSTFAALRSKPVKDSSADVLLRTLSSCSDFGEIRFLPLPGSAQETHRVVKVWKNSQSQPTGSSAVHLTGAKATEAAFKKTAPGKRVIHLATHGFFLGGRCPAVTDGLRAIGGLSASTPRPTSPVSGESPLLLAGLALAGANHREAAAPLEEDGILTAQEISSMSLTGLEWAVLSACDTGTGKLEAGEGVLGLRRAFQIAGARTVINSLWSVEDRSTLRWMTILYEGRFQDGLDTAEAVRRASLELLRQRRRDGETTHPFYWAGFVAAGDWR